MSSSPSTRELYDLINAIKANKIDVVKSLLNPPNNTDSAYTKNLLQLPDTRNRQSVLMYCCEATSKEGAFDILQFVCEEITRQVDGHEFLRKQLFQADCDGWTCLAFVCRVAREHRTIKFIVDNILRVGGKELLFDLLPRKDKYHLRRKDSWSVCFSKAISNTNITRESIELLACYLHDFNVWVSEYNVLHEADKTLLNREFGMTGSWSPSIDVLTSSLSTVTIFSFLTSFGSEVKGFSENRQQDKLQEFIEKKCDYYGGRTMLMEACKVMYDSNIGHPRLFKPLIDDIIRIVGGDVFCKQLLEIKNENEDGMTCMMYLCRYCASEEIFNFMFAKIVQCESRKCLYDVLQSSTTKGSSLLKLLMEKWIWFSDSNESVGLMNCGLVSMCHLLAHFELFWGQYSVLSKSEQKMLVGTLKIDQNFKADLKVLRDLKRQAYQAEKQHV